MEEKKDIYIYNTYGKEKQKLETIKSGICSIYSCGPTVYDYAHIGNFRYFLFVDLLRRTLKQDGYILNHVMNITDVGHLVSDSDYGEDKMLKAARREKKSPFEIAKYYEKAFLEDMEKLNISKPEKIVRATDNIKIMEEYVKKIIENGYAYETEDTVYFDTSKLDKYGVLSAHNNEQIAGARIEFDKEKRNETDFAIWIKAPENHIMKWDSFFGKSYPGWHIECSAMSEKYLGNHFDIHTGGEDHIHIHHENEIAQSKGHSNTDNLPAKYWMHSGFLRIDGGKMSKSLQNTYTISDLEKRGFNALDFKYFTFSSSYRIALNFTFDALKASKDSLFNLRKIYFESKKTKEKKQEEILNSEKIKLTKEIVSKKLEEFYNAIYDDLNVTKGLGIVWQVARYSPDNMICEFLDEVDKILGLKLSDEKIYNNSLKEYNEKIEISDLPENIQEIIARRKKARKEKDYELSDKLRDELNSLGYIVIDEKDEMRIEKNG